MTVIEDELEMTEFSHSNIPPPDPDNEDEYESQRIVRIVRIEMRDENRVCLKIIDYQEREIIYSIYCN